MAYNLNQVPDAPMPLSMLPAAAPLKKADLLYVVQPGNNPGEKARSLSLEALAGSDILKFGSTPIITTNILEYTGALAPTTQGNSWTEVCHLDIDPRLDAEFHVWGTSGHAYQSQGSDQTRFSYGLRARVRQMYLPDDQDRDLITTYWCGDRFEIVVDESTQVIQPAGPTYNTVFNCLPFDYTGDLVLSHYPTKKVTLYLSGGVSANPYQCHQPDSYSLKIQARIYPAHIDKTLLKATGA